jgi:recombination protein RecT
MNDPVPSRRISQVELYVGEVLPPDSPILRALPAGIDAKRFRNSLQLAVMLNPGLLKVDPRLTFREVARAANLGLSLDPMLGEGWLIVRRNHRTNRDEPSFQMGYRGKLRLARQSGEVARIAAYPVTQKSLSEGRFKVTLDAIHYEPDVFNDESPVVGYFAFVRYKDGAEDFETMSMRDIYQIRARSDGYRAFAAGKIKSTPWAPESKGGSEGEMARKTVLNRLLKRVPMNADVAHAMAQDDEIDRGEDIDREFDEAAQERTPQKQIERSTVPEDDDEPRQRRRRRTKAEMEAARSPETDAGEEDTSETGNAVGKARKEDYAAYDTVEEDELGERIDQETGEIEAHPSTAKMSEAYERGMRDAEKGITKCLNSAIRDNPAAFREWEAGQADAIAQGRT